MYNDSEKSIVWCMFINFKSEDEPLIEAGILDKGENLFSSIFHTIVK